MTPTELGFSPERAAWLETQAWTGLVPARVIRAERDRYQVHTGPAIYEAEVTGQMRFAAETREALPVVGDWVAVMPYDADQAIIHHLLPRHSLLARQAPGTMGVLQPIAANLDTAFILVAVGQNMSLNRLERYVALCEAAGIEAVPVITKVDLAAPQELQDIGAALRRRHPQWEPLFLSSVAGTGLDALRAHLQPAHTYCVLGSSGVGKSTLLNTLLGTEVAKTAAVSQSHAKGRHTTTGRALYVLPEGALLIDTPGMREVGLTGEGAGVEGTFEDVVQLATQCRFADCTHQGEPGCAVQEAIEAGTLAEEVLHHYHKLLREQEHAADSLAERRRKDRATGRLHRAILKDLRGRKY